MAVEKILNTRIQLKYDSFANWENKNPKLLDGEIAIAKLTTTGAVKPTESDAQAPVLFKVGPGNFKDLPWVSGLAADVYAWAKKTEDEFKTWVNTIIDHPVLTIEDTGTGKFITGIEITKGKVIVTRANVQWSDIEDVPGFANDNTVTTITAGEHMGDITDEGENGNHAYVVNGKDWSDEIEAIEVFETSETVLNTLGGIKAGANLNGLTTREILNKLLYPYTDAIVGTVSTTPSRSTNEHGVTKTITQVSVPVTKKTSPITSVALYNGDTLIEEKTGDAVKNGGTFTFSGLNIVVPTDGNQLTVKVTYAGEDGVAKTVSQKSSAFVFVYPYYYGVCAKDAEINEELVESLTKEVIGKQTTKTYTYTCDNQRAVIAYPKAHGALSKILDPNSFDVTASFTKHEVSVTGLDGKAQNYYVYVNDAFTKTGFAFTFNI